MKIKIIGFITVIFFLFSIFSPILYSKSTPKLNNGKKWRIGYYEGGPYSDYTDTMRTLVKGLIELGWITDKNVPDHHEEMPKPYLNWLVKGKSPYLSFAPEDCYSANWDDKRRIIIRDEILDKLALKQLDLVIAMGTWAGLDLANDQHSVPVMVLSTSNPVRAGIIDSADNSGFDHVTARVDPNRYLRQIRMFHRIVGFKTLGIAYENTQDGRLYSAVSDVHQVAEERGFKVIPCEVYDTTSDIQKSDKSCIECYQKLAKMADAVYVTALTCADRQESEIAKIFRAAKKPTFSMLGSKFVKKGLMLSISSDSGYSELGRYNARKLGEILNGTKPGSLNQLAPDPLDIAINIKTARQIGFHVPETILRIAAEVYEE